MKRWYVVALIILLMGALYLFSRPDPVLVTVVGVSSGVVEETVSNTRAGTVKSCQRSKLSLPIGGQINKLYVREGELAFFDSISFTHIEFVSAYWWADKQTLCA